MKPLILAAVAGLMLSCQAPAAAFAESPVAEAPITRADREAALNDLSRRLDHYVLTQFKAPLRARLAEDRQALLSIEDPEAFRAAVTERMYAITHDRHLSLWIDRSNPDAGAASPAPETDPLAGERRGAWGLTDVRRLPGNVGYLRMDGFSGHPRAGEAVDAAMSLLRGSDALILDLRRNGGGGEAALNRLLAHFAAEPMPMMTIEMRRCAPDPADPEGCVQDGSRDTQVRFADRVADPAFPTRPVYVLISHDTFSAAEEAAYDFQASHRATLVGQTTGGGGNPSAGMSVGRRFMVIMPIGVTRHPLTGGGWEGVGVRPDVEVPADQALVEAYGRALRASGAAEAADPAAALRRDAGV